jgi:ankyrin repeat protein
VIALLLTLQGCFLFPSYIGRLETYTPEVAAAQSGDIAKVQAALDLNPKLVKYREWEGATLLHAAVGRDQAAMVAILLARGANVNGTDKRRITPLHLAATNGNVPIIRLLLGRGAKLNPVDNSGRTPLDRAVEWEQPEAAAFLRSQGARSNGHPGSSRNAPTRGSGLRAGVHRGRRFVPTAEARISATVSSSSRADRTSFRG